MYVQNNKCIWLYISTNRLETPKPWIALLLSICIDFISSSMVINSWKGDCTVLGPPPQRATVLWLTVKRKRPLLSANDLWPGRDLYCSTLLWHGASVFAVSSKHYLFAYYTNRRGSRMFLKGRDWEDKRGLNWKLSKTCMVIHVINVLTHKNNQYTFKLIKNFFLMTFLSIAHIPTLHGMWNLAYLSKGLFDFFISECKVLQHFFFN